MFDALWERFPHATLAASGEAVGLPPGQMGNSEVGHLTIGSGRILFQDLARVNPAVADGSFADERRARLRVQAGARARGRRPSSRARLVRRGALAHRPPARAARPGRARGDGRADVDPRVHRRPRRLAARGGERPRGASRSSGSRRSAAATTRWIATVAGNGPIARSARSVSEKARWPTIPIAAVRASYERGVTDEFVEPVVLAGRPRLASAATRPSSSTSAPIGRVSSRSASSRPAST